MGILKKSWRRGLEPFLYFGEFNALRIDRKPLTESDRVFLKKNKSAIIKEIMQNRRL